MRLSSYKRLAPVGLLLAAFVVASDARATLEDVCSGKTPFVSYSAGSNDFGANFNMHAFHAWWYQAVSLMCTSLMAHSTTHTVPSQAWRRSD